MVDDTTDSEIVSASALTKLGSPYLRSRLKRAMDLIIGTVGIALTITMFPFVAALIKLDSNGSIFFRQKRLGMDGREFEMIKFRTMALASEKGKGGLWTSKNDPRITRVGKILRNMYIDEFPQWWNVLKGDMSVIGPRPELPEGHKLVVNRYPRFVERLTAKPGITGLAQTEYKYTVNVRDFRNKLTYDQKYIQRASPSLDLWIIMRTIKRMVCKRGS
ncbi:sugar transferase [Dehalococcoides mccartyi]|nr:sugar transferase [Dehalococcoides mccartyi]